MSGTPTDNPQPRAERRIGGCLLQAGIQYPQDDVIVCGHCPNRSDTVGNLGTECKATP